MFSTLSGFFEENRFSVTASACVIVVCAVIGFWVFGSSHRATYDLCVDVYRQLDECKKKDVSSEHWRVAGRDVSSQIQETVAKLEQEANSEDPVSRYLLWALRDCATQMFDVDRAAAEESETRFLKWMSKAEYELFEPGDRGRLRTYGAPAYESLDDTVDRDDFNLDPDQFL